MKEGFSLKEALRPFHKVYTYIRYEFCKRRLRIMVHDDEETIQKILDDKVSVSRFGDGEFYLMWQLIGSPFQKKDTRLSERLREVIHSQSDNLIVCVPYYLHRIDPDLKMRTQRWARDWVVRYVDLIKQTFDEISNKTFYDTNFTRFYVNHNDKAKSKRHIELIKKFWEDRDVCIIEGESTRFGVGNDLLSKAKSVKRILCPPVNAFDKYDEILQTALNLVPKDSLVVCALGMTATVLAYDLSRNGYQAIDMGHLDIEYEWLLMGATEKTAVKNKAVNEVGVRKVEDTVKDTEYTSSIIATIGL